MPTQSRLVQLALAGQTAKGAAATTPAYVVGLTGGSVYQVELEENELDTTWSNRGLAGYDRTQGVPVVDASLVGMPKSIGELLLLAMGDDVVTGVGPYTHTFTVADSLPWATSWGKYGTNSAQLTDLKCDSLELEWEKTGAVKLKTKLVGCAMDLSVAFPSIPVGAAEVVADGVMRGQGGTFTVDGAAARVISGSIKIENNLDVIVPAYSVTPDMIFEARASMEISLKIKPDNMNTWRKIVTGSTSGSTISADVLYGEFETGFTGPDGATLDFSATKVAWTCSMPDADPSGGAAELSLTGKICLPASGSPLTAVLVNDVATYEVV